MLKKITKWETEDGKVFDTQEEAEDYMFEQEAQIAALQAVQAAVPNGRWIERWHGSGGKEGLEGWSILDAESRALVAYLGRNVDSETVTAITMAHNATSEGVPEQMPEAIEQMAVDRYKVVPSHESMFHRWAVVAGNGTQQLYVGRKVECLNMARKFVGAFLDGAFVAMQNTAPAYPAEGVSAQSYVVDFFREKGFYPSLAQAFTAGVAHTAAMPAQSVNEIMELADEYAGAQACAVTATSTEDADTTKERNALLSAIRAARSAPAVPAAVVVPEGWALVPLEATQEMMEAWGNATELPEGMAERSDNEVNAYAAQRDWKAMLAVAPAVVAVPDERSAFETWSESVGLYHLVRGFGKQDDYAFVETRRMWEAWKASTALAAQAKQGEQP